MTLYPGAEVGVGRPPHEAPIVEQPSGPAPEKYIHVLVAAAHPLCCRIPVGVGIGADPLVGVGAVQAERRGEHSLTPGVLLV